MAGKWRIFAGTVFGEEVFEEEMIPRPITNSLTKRTSVKP
jgi:hypothetical protein